MPSTNESFAMLVSKAADFIVSAAHRQQENPQNEAISINDPTLSVLQEVVQSFQDGTSLVHLKDRIDKLIINQEQRAELISQLLLSHEYSRLVKYLMVRNHLEDELVGASLRDDLSVGEKMIMLKMADDVVNSLSSKIQAGSTSMHDVMSIISKVDYTLQVNEGSLKQKFKRTTPQGREIVRKLAYRLQSAVSKRS